MKVKIFLKGKKVKWMSKYTTEVRYICEHYAGLEESQGYDDVETVIVTALPKVFDFSFPIFDENYRPQLEKKILRHYYTREIGLETVGLWKLKLNTKLNEIMPYYNQLYESALIEIDPLSNYKYHKEGENAESGSGNRSDTKSTSGSGTGSVITNSTNRNVVDEESSLNGSYTNDGLYWDKYSDTPQGGVNGLDSDTYLTNARKNTTDEDSTSDEDRTLDRTTTDTGNMTTNSTSSNTVNETGSGTQSHNKSGTYEEDVIGYTGVSSSELILKFRETFLNIDMMIINDLEELFMQLW